MPNPRRILTDRPAVLAELAAAAVVGADGRRWVRMVAATRILGVLPSVLQSWERDGLVRVLRTDVPRSPRAPRGRLVAYELQGLQAAVRSYAPRWSTDEDDLLMQWLGSPRASLATIARRLGRSVQAVRARTQQLGVNRRTGQGLVTTGEAAQLLGVSREAVNYWCLHAETQLRYVRLPDGQREKLIEPGDLIDHVKAHRTWLWDRLGRDQRGRLAAMAMASTHLHDLVIPRREVAA